MKYSELKKHVDAGTWQHFFTPTQTEPIVSVKFSVKGIPFEGLFSPDNDGIFGITPLDSEKLFSRLSELEEES